MMEANIKRVRLFTYSVMVCSQLTQPYVALAATGSARNPVSSPVSVQLDQEYIFRLIDQGDLPRLRQHISYYNSFMELNPDAANNFRLNLEFTDAAGNTPLIRAAGKPSTEIVQYLVMQGANMSAENARWETPLITAYNTGNFNNAKFLLSRGAPDPYQVSKRMAAYDKTLAHAEKRAEAASNVSKNLSILGGAAVASGAIVGGVAAFGGSSGSSSGGVTQFGGTGSETIDCGAGAGIHPEACTADTFDTAEAQNQEGVLGLNADEAYERGYDGHIYNRNPDGSLVDEVADGRVMVAVVDTGVDYNHPELDGIVRQDLSVTCDADGVCTQGGYDGDDAHGTWVAGTLAAERNETGAGTMHGIAPGVQMIAVDAGTDAGLPTASTSAGIYYATNAGARVINNSYGSSTLITDAVPATLRTQITTNFGTVSELDAYSTAVTNDSVLVFAAGNDGVAQPSDTAGLIYYFQGDYLAIPGANPKPLQTDYDTVNPTALDFRNNWVVAVSVDDTNTISTFSQQCGVTRYNCLAAPGEIALLPKAGDTGYDSNLTGTSFAAPNVSGAIAIMMGAFPQLTSGEVLTILFDTAVDLGAVGVDTVYGRGLIDLDAATDPTTGGWVLSVSGGPAAASSFAFDSSGFGLSAPFGNALANSNSRIMFQDAYGKDYLLPLSSVSNSLTPQKTAFENFMQFADNEFDTTMQDGSTRFSYAQASFSDPNYNQNVPFERFSFATEVPMGKSETASVAFNYKTDPAQALADNGGKRMLVGEAYLNPYVNVFDRASSGVLGYHEGQVSYKLAAYYGRASEEYSYHFDDTKPVSGVYAEARLSAPETGADITLNNGVSFEKNSLLGSETSGAFGIDSSTTYHAGITGRFLAAEDVVLLANYNMGMTQVNASGSSIFANFSSILTNSFAAGIELGNVRATNDTLGFVLSQPLRVMSGSADMTLPYDVASNGSILFRNDRLNLSPSGRQLDMESYYHLPLDATSTLYLNAIYRMNPNNGASENDDMTVLGKYNYSF